MITEEKTDRMLLCKYYFLCLPGSAKLVIIREEQTDRMLLCNYNFLRLPGSAKLVMIRKEKTDRKLRFYNYKKLCSLARKGVHSLHDNLYLEMLKAAFLQRKKTVDFVINLINAKNVPLKLF